MKARDFDVRVFILEKYRDDPFTGLDSSDVTFIPDNAYQVGKIEGVELNFTSNYIHVEDALNVFVGHGQGYKLIAMEVNLLYPHIRVVISKLRHEYFLAQERFGTQYFSNNALPNVPSRYIESGMVDFFFAGNYLKLDRFYQNDVDDVDWPDDDGKPRLLYAPTYGGHSASANVIMRLLKNPRFNVAFRPHNFTPVEGATPLPILHGNSLEAYFKADVVVSDKSSSLNEAAILGKKVIRLDDFDVIDRGGTSWDINMADIALNRALWCEMSLDAYDECDYDSLAFPDKSFLDEQFPTQDGTVAEKILDYTIVQFEKGGGR